jgi:hypothetical protein
MRLLLLSLLLCLGGCLRQDPDDSDAVETNCANDGIDDDGDGLYDCADPDCAEDPACSEADTDTDTDTDTDADADGDSDADADTDVPLGERAYPIVVPGILLLEPALDDFSLATTLKGNLILHVEGSEDDTDAVVTLAAALPDTNPPVQDTCYPTAQLPDAVVKGGYTLAGEGREATFPVGDVLVTVHDISFEMKFKPEYASLEQGLLGGYIDARELAEAYPEGGESADDLCARVADMGAACEACPSDSAVYCLTFQFLAKSQIEADLDVKLVAEAFTDPDCDPEAGTCACSGAGGLATGGLGLSALALLALRRRR